MHAYLDHAGILAFAHRGDHQSGPENTLPAFAGAVALGFKYLETDVHCTSDDVLLAFHDQRLDRVTDRDGVIAQLPYAQVRQALVAAKEPIPLMEDLLNAFPDTRFNIDLKADNTVAPFIKLLKRSRCLDRICIGSFDDRRVAAIRQAFPLVCTSMGPKEVFRARLASFRMPFARLRAACAQVPVSWERIPVADRRFISAMRERQIQTHVWTVNDPQAMHDLLELGVDGIMTDYPVRLKAVLQERNAWVD